MPVFNRYRYERLCARDEIRLLALDPAKRRDTPLSASLVHRRRSEAIEEYSAVSYVWGQEKSIRSLEISDGSDTSYLRITPTVDVLLRYLRKTKKLRYLWIDAICLNQEDEAEKAHQVPQMDRIYSGADQVRIWLGHENPMTTSVYSFFRKATRETKTERQTDTAQRLAGLMKEHFGSVELGDFMKPGCRAGILLAFDFFEQSWFTRRWVVQEAVMARRAITQCGSVELSLPVVVSAAKLLMCCDLSHYGASMAASLHTIRDEGNILDSLWKYHKAQCRDKKDRVAALIGLNPTEGFVLDYNSDWREMYHKLASFHLRNVDNIADICPCSLDVSDKAEVALCDGDLLRIQPQRSGNKAPAWRVTYALLVTEQDCDPDRIVDMLQDLFPLSTAGSADDLMGLSFLLKAVAGFNDWKNKDGSALLVALSKQCAETLPRDAWLDVLGALQHLTCALRELCLLELRPYGCPETGRAVGFGPKWASKGDLALPLWRQKHKDWRSGSEGVLTTVLLLKADNDSPGKWATAKQAGRDFFHVSGEGPLGPAIFFEFGNAAQNLPLETNS
ncbi:hypothetical protein MCOR02_004921 [Pyricularia oryzae]|nr:hypothetical protein MCOR01_006690 [Pyricularia oryzae]KAH9436011.1 hypothetical protein MCOR02_004921 [Pyricularia oryzae]KAI6276254.1 hypothetical protein MCOR26_005684 [Pyricularia oryzae]KAI6301356.1 hypothetical protein MCOR34_009007 [Pyricularia oryzae]KAI6322177.1 hypothetical protein MCOR30_007727 [Pyricularia oryzae]